MENEVFGFWNSKSIFQLNQSAIIDKQGNIMDNPSVVLDEDDISEEEQGETIRLRPYYDWRVRYLYI